MDQVLAKQGNPSPSEKEFNPKTYQKLTDEKWEDVLKSSLENGYLYKVHDISFEGKQKDIKEYELPENMIYFGYATRFTVESSCSDFKVTRKEEKKAEVKGWGNNNLIDLATNGYL